MSKRASSYDPADSGLAKYFMAMLDDADRNQQYGEAIRRAIQEFKQREGRAPTVLDIGVGTGMLSCLCVVHGAKHVTSVDTNSTMVALAKESLAAVDPSGKRYTVKRVEAGSSKLGEKKYDMFVSEILGTLTTSESMYKYIQIYAHQYAAAARTPSSRRLSPLGLSRASSPPFGSRSLAVAASIRLATRSASTACRA
jgi:SAM-dependent methyltransferase